MSESDDRERKRLKQKMLDRWENEGGKTGDIRPKIARTNQVSRNRKKGTNRSGTSIDDSTVSSSGKGKAKPHKQ